ncbi:hypothetical protein [Citrobacter braakii]|uniref:hypothetical protein n=1 Tax=Citrobacter braakii TaxID=57706 RepID=UPI00307601B8
MEKRHVIIAYPARKAAVAIGGNISPRIDKSGLPLRTLEVDCGIVDGRRFLAGIADNPAETQRNFIVSKGV